jgi:acetyl esterase/lipase
MKYYFVLCMIFLLVLNVSGQELDIPINITLEKDVVYSVVDGMDLTLDIAFPSDTKFSLPAIVHIHGGGWRNGAKSTKRALQYANNGFIGVSINYRLSGTAIFPACIHDCKAAIRWLRANAKKYHLDVKKIGVTGNSAGGHLVALLGTSAGDSYLEGNQGNLEFSSAVQAVVDHFGPTDLLRMDDNLPEGAIKHLTPNSPEAQLIGGLITERKEQTNRANPIAYVDANDPPILMIHGEEDRTVIFNQSELLFDALNEAGTITKLVKVMNAGHGYRPYPKDATINPNRKQIDKLELDWFTRHLTENYLILDTRPKTIIVNGYSTSFLWPQILQRKLDRFYSGQKIIEVKKATKGGTPIAGWMDRETGEPKKP